MIQFGNKKYVLLKDHKNGWNPEAFEQRYSEVLDRYDVIVGDWGYNQLRLKGFFKEKQAKANKDSLVQSIEDYIIEHCNFGCSYFVLQRIKNPQHPKKESNQNKELQKSTPASS